MNTTDIAKQLGKIGGDATKKKHGTKHFSEARRKDMEKRWGQKPAKDVI